MVTLNKIYTRTGDLGETSLGDNTRRNKDDIRVEAYGSVDELNSSLGMAMLYLEELPDLKNGLFRIQNDLFDLGADLCHPEFNADEEMPYEPLRMQPEQTKRLESEIDAMNAALNPLKSFILPGGSAAAAHLHLARTIARRAERHAISLSKREAINQNALIYLNRLSDWLFVAARISNGNGRDDILWVPGANRKSI